MSSFSLNHQKADLRDRVKALLAAIPEGTWASKSAAAAARLIALPAFAAAKVVMMYCPIQREIDPAAAARAAFAGGKTVCLPRVDWVDGTMQPARIDAWGAGLSTGKNGIREPAGSAPLVSVPSIGLVLVPGLAFDSAGGRLGRGSGFYDRFLTGLAAFKVGACLDEQVVDAVPMGPKDVRLDAVVTPTRTLLRGA